MKLKIFFLFIILYLIPSCSYDNRSSGHSPFIYAKDTISLKLKFAESNYAIPSPAQISFMMEQFKLPYYFENIIIHQNNFNKINNSTIKNSLNLGTIGTILYYLNLYNKKEQANKYINELTDVMNDLGISESIDKSIINNLRHYFGVRDTFRILLSQIYRSIDKHLKDNDQWDISVLIVTGGWIESFYEMTQLYANTKDNEIYYLITYQGPVIENLIKMLAPYYEKSTDFSGLIDDMVNLAYEFDVFEFNSSIFNISTDTVFHITKIHNEMTIENNCSGLDNIIRYTKDFHNK